MASPWPANGPPVPTATDTWQSIRIPKDANSEPSWEDYKLSFSFTEHAEGIGCTGWDWQALRSRWVAFDFDASPATPRAWASATRTWRKSSRPPMQLPYVEVRKSTGGGGIHLYVYFDAAGIPARTTRSTPPWPAASWA